MPVYGPPAQQFQQCPFPPTYILHPCWPLKNEVQQGSDFFFFLLLIWTYICFSTWLPKKRKKIHSYYKILTKTRQCFYYSFVQEGWCLTNLKPWISYSVAALQAFSLGSISAYNNGAGKWKAVAILNCSIQTIEIKIILRQ